jgi:hypothetical protein
MIGCEVMHLGPGACNPRAGSQVELLGVTEDDTGLRLRLLGKRKASTLKLFIKPALSLPSFLRFIFVTRSSFLDKIWEKLSGINGLGFRPWGLVSVRQTTTLFINNFLKYVVRFGGRRHILTVLFISYFLERLRVSGCKPNSKSFQF